MWHVSGSLSLTHLPLGRYRQESPKSSALASTHNTEFQQCFTESCIFSPTRSDLHRPAGLSQGEHQEQHPPASDVVGAEIFLDVSAMSHNILKVFLSNVFWDIFPRGFFWFFFYFGENPGLVLLGYKFFSTRIFVFLYVPNALRATAPLSPSHVIYYHMKTSFTFSQGSFYSPSEGSDG